MDLTQQSEEANGNNSNSDSSREENMLIDEYHIIHGPEKPTDQEGTTLNAQDNAAVVAVASTNKKDNNTKPVKQNLAMGSEMQGASTVEEANIISDQPLHEPQHIVCPRVNCPEKIIICLDLNEEMDTTTFRSRSGDKYSGLELAKRAVKMFVMHKTQMNPQHEFAFLIFHEESTMIHSFTSRAQDILNTLDESEIETQKSGPLNLSHMFETIKENIELPVVDGDPQVIPPPYIVRVLLVFGRSHCVPLVTNREAQRELESSPYFFTDVLYIHDPPSEDNRCEEIFPVLCDLDHNGMSYIFEQSKYTPILNSGAKLLAHPLQRPRQLEAMYKIGSPVPTAPPPPVAAE